MHMQSNDRETWASILRQLRASAPGICRQWFEELEAVGIDRGVLRLRAHSNIHRDYLQRQCLKPFQEAAQSVTGRLVTVIFLGPEDPAAPLSPSAQPATSSRLDRAAHAGNGSPGAAPAPAEAGASSSPVVEPKISTGSRLDNTDFYADGLVLNPDYAFENFVVGPVNRLAHAAAVAVAANPGRAYNPFFVHGNVGLGKTHLLQAICLSIREKRPDARIYYTSCEGFVTQFIDAVQAGEMSHFRHKFRDVDVLVVDDIHFLTKRDRTQEEFFHTFNALHQAHKQIVLSSDAPPHEIPDLEDRLVSRFTWGLVTSVERPGYETRVSIIKNKARLRQFELTDEAAGYIASRIETNIRELEGAVVKVQMIASVDNRPADLEVAKQALGDDGSPVGRPERQVQLQTIVNAVTDFYSVKLTDLQSKRRHRSIALPRQICMHLARLHTRFSLAEIGGYFGGRDHTTVMHAIEAVQSRCKADTDFAAVIQNLSDRVRGSMPGPAAAVGT